MLTNRSVLGLSICLALLLLVLPGAAQAAECTNTWTGPTEGNWATAGNWSAGHAPTSSEVACIGAEKTAKVNSGSQTAAAIQGEGRVVISVGSGTTTLDVTGAPEAGAIKSLWVGNNGVLTGAGAVYVSSVFNWGGTITGSGPLVLQSGVTSAVEGTGRTIKQRTIVNEGTMNYSAGYIAMYEGARIENSGTINANSESVSGIVWEGAGVEPSILNTGTFQKTSGTGETKIGVNLENKGTLNAKTGKFAFTRAEAEVILADESILAGTVQTTNSTVVGQNFDGTAATALLGSGPLAMEAGKTGTIANVVGGNMGGAGTLEITTSLNWSGGTMTGTGTSVVLPGATASITSSGHLIKQRTLRNEGTMTYTAGYVAMYEGAKIENTGTFNADAENISGIVWEGGGTQPKVVNTGSGTFRKTAGTGTTKVEVPFHNEGTAEAQTGMIRFGYGGSSTGGTWEAKPGASILVARGSFPIKGGTLIGAITLSETAATAEGVNASAANLALGGSFSLEGVLDIVKGTIEAEKFRLSFKGMVTGAGTLQVADTFTWESQGQMSGSGSTVVLPEATGTLTAPLYGFRMQERTFVNQGTTTYVSSYFELREGARLINSGTFNANSESVSGIVPDGPGPTPKIVNTGLFRKTVGTSTTKVVVPFENLGQVETQTGELKIEKPIYVGTTEEFGKRCRCGDPIETATGTFTEAQSDFEIGGRGVGLDLVRSYSSRVAATATGPGAFGYGWSNTFGDLLRIEEGGKKVTAVRAGGNTVPFAETGPGAYSGPAWSQETLSGSTGSGFTLTDPDQTAYEFSGAGRLESVADRNGNETTLQYSEAGRLESVTDPVGRKLKFTYNVGGLVEKVEDPMGHVAQYAYEGQTLKSVTLPGEGSPRWQYKYDGSRRMTQMTDGRGGKTTNEYDGSGRVKSQTDPLGTQRSFEYFTFRTKVTNKATGSVTDQRFTSNNQPYSVTYGFGTASAVTERFSYDDGGRLLKRTDGNGHSTTFTYDAAGNRTSERDAAGNEWEWEYNGTHDVVSETTPGGETTTIARDADGNPESVSRPAPGGLTQITEYGFNGFGELETLTDPLARTWDYGYDAYGNRSAETSPEGDERTWIYDLDSRAITAVSARGNEEGAEPAEFTTSIERDPRGRPLKVTNPVGATTKFSYDGNGNIATETDPNGNKTTYSYNSLDQQTKVEKPNGDVLETSYNGAGAMIGQTDGNKDKTTYVRNVLDQPVEVIDPLERKTTQEFDPAGNLKSKTDAGGRKTTYSYDAADRLVKITYSDEVTPTAEFEYDDDGRLTAMTDGTGASSFDYDQLGRMIRSENGNSDVVEFDYTLANEQSEIVYPNGKAVTQEFDGSGRLESVADWLGGTTTFAYNADSAVQSTTFPAGTGNVDEFSYDRANWMTGTTMKRGGETLAELTYTRDGAGLVDDLTSAGLPGAGEEEFGYDENSRLTETGAGAYEYDAANNPVKAPGSVNTFDAASQLETGTGVSYGYNLAGQRTSVTPSSGPATSYAYDQAGRLTSVERAAEGEVPAIEESYEYDGSGLRTAQTVSATTSYLTWSLTSEMPQLLSDGQYSYLYGPLGEPIMQISSGEEPSYLHRDQIGSTRVLTDSSGEVSGTFTYGVYGAAAGSTGTEATRMGYAGQYTDSQSGLQYLRARYYDPLTAQFLSEDPIEAVTRESYMYGGANPLLYTDPMGLGLCIGGFIDCDEDDDPCGSVWSGPMNVLCALPDDTADDVRDAAAGFGDGATTGWTAAARDALGQGGGVDECSFFYQAGNLAGTLNKEAVLFSAGAGGLGRLPLRIRPQAPRDLPHRWQGPPRDLDPPF